MTMKFIAPDDNNAKDTTVMQVKLPHPVAPGDVLCSLVYPVARHPFGESFWCARCAALTEIL